MWRVYCRIWNDIGLAPPGRWIQEWMRRDLIKHDIMDSEYNEFANEAVRYYMVECHE